MTKEEIIANFDPNGPATGDTLFGLPFEMQHAKVVVLPVPWEVTVSYAAGTSKGPEAILAASAQVDLFDPFVPDAWKMGIWMAPISEEVKAKSDFWRAKAEELIEDFQEPFSEAQMAQQKEINAACAEMKMWVKNQVQNYLRQGKKVILLGGDHSTPLGYFEALAEEFDSFGILQIDAHADLRNAYEGFAYSHASIMHNALQIPQVEKLVQVGIRDYCEEEVMAIKNANGRIKTFFDRDLKHAQFAGETWAKQVEKIIAALPEKVFVSFDIDGLDPKLCPNTGTPVAGGFEAEEVLFLLEKLHASGRQIIGMDLNEVSPGADEWDANVGARLLYRMCNLLGS